MKNKYKKGYVLLLTVLVVSAFSLAIGVFVLSSGIYNTQNSVKADNMYRSLSMAEACAEDALMEIRNNPVLYASTSTITINDDVCTYRISNQGTNRRRVETESNADGMMTKFLIIANLVSTTLDIESWEEVKQF